MIKNWLLFGIAACVSWETVKIEIKWILINRNKFEMQKEPFASHMKCWIDQIGETNIWKYCRKMTHTHTLAQINKNKNTHTALDWRKFIQTHNRKLTFKFLLVFFYLMKFTHSIKCLRSQLMLVSKRRNVFDWINFRWTEYVNMRGWKMRRKDHTI